MTSVGVYAGRTLRVPLAVWLVGPLGARNLTREVGNVQWRSTIPGGFAECTIDLNRSLSVHTPEIGAYQTVRVTDTRSGQLVYQGRLEDPGKTVSESGSVWSLTAFGMQVHTKDITRPYVAIDKDLSRWQRGYGTKTYVSDSREDDSDPAPGGGRMGPSIKFTAAPALSIPAGTVLARYYYPGFVESGQSPASISGAGRNGPQTGTDATGFQFQVILYSNTELTDADPYVQTSFAAMAFPQAFTFVYGEPTWFDQVGKQVPVIGWKYDGASTRTSGSQTWCMFGADLIVRAVMHRKDGTTIIPEQSTSEFSATLASASEIVADLLGGGRLPKFDGANASIVATERSMDQFAYPDPVTTDQLLNDLMTQEPLCYWAVWETNSAGKARFEWSLWPNEVRHVIPMNGGVDLPTSNEEVYNAVSVRWTDALERIRNTRLTSDVPVLTAAGLTREAALDLGDNMSSLRNAEKAGAGFLADHAAPRGTGTITVTGRTMDRFTGRELAPWELRPGCIIQIAGADPSGYSQRNTTRNGRNVFRVVATDFDASSGACTLELDSPARSVWDQVAAAHRDIEQRRRR